VLAAEYYFVVPGYYKIVPCQGGHYVHTVAENGLLHQNPKTPGIIKAMAVVRDATRHRAVVGCGLVVSQPTNSIYSVFSLEHNPIWPVITHSHHHHTTTNNL
jgi:hypothetical protein